jgi:single-strand DNA-binding protein|tara:strand:- start:1884 stop:2285 length:402 start_codon:yes stop_codon:yes gene_type:complete
MNNVTVVGNITRDPEIRFFSGDKSVVNTGLAINKSFKNAKGEWQEETDFVDLSIWQNAGAENVANSLSKGDRVIVSGALKQNTWQTDTGENRSKVEITVLEIGPTMKWAEVSVTRNAKKASTGKTYTTEEEVF